MNSQPEIHIGLASAIAGPAVLLFAAIAFYISSIPDPITIDWRGSLPALALIPLSLIIGFVPALVFNGIGSVIMVQLGHVSPLLRFPFLWPVVGGCAAGFAAKGLDMPWEIVFAFAGAGAVSAMICRMRLA